MSNRTVNLLFTVKFNREFHPRKDIVSPGAYEVLLDSGKSMTFDFKNLYINKRDDSDRSVVSFEHSYLDKEYNPESECIDVDFIKSIKAFRSFYIDIESDKELGLLKPVEMKYLAFEVNDGEKSELIEIDLDTVPVNFDYPEEDTAFTKTEVFVEMYKALHPKDHFFDEDNLEFFGEDVSDMIVSQFGETIVDWEGIERSCYMLTAKHKDRQDSYYFFDKDSLDRISPRFFVEQKKIEIETVSGTILAYDKTISCKYATGNTSYPGLSVMFRPKGSNREFELLRFEIDTFSGDGLSLMCDEPNGEFEHVVKFPKKLWEELARKEN